MHRDAGDTNLPRTAGMHSVALFKVDIDCILALKCTCYAPGAINVNSLALRQRATQCVKVETWQVDTLGPASAIGRHEPPADK